MFDFSASRIAVPEDLQELFTSTWAELASPGSGWDGTEKVAIAGRSRALRNGSRPGTEVPLPAAADGAIEMITIEPSRTTEESVRQVVSQIGEAKYVELVGIVATVTGVDVMTKILLGSHEPLPTPVAGNPIPDLNPRARKRSGWVSMAGPPLPRNALSAVPATQAIADRLLNRMYMTTEDHDDPGPVRGLARVQLELVATAVSHINRCFYCTLSHLISMRARAAEQGTSVDHRAITRPEIDPGIEGGRELLSLAAEATKPAPDPKPLLTLADVIGPRAAVTALEVAASFVMTNRIIEATGQPVLVNQREKMMPQLEEIGADSFPHSGLTIQRDKPGLLTRIRRKLAGSKRRNAGRR